MKEEETRYTQNVSGGSNHTISQGSNNYFDQRGLNFMPYKVPTSIVQGHEVE